MEDNSRARNSEEIVNNLINYFQELDSSYEQKINRINKYFSSTIYKQEYLISKYNDEINSLQIQ